MELKTLHVQRRSSGSVDLELQLSTNATELQENSKLLQQGAPAPILQAMFAQADQYVSRLRTNLNIGNAPLHDLPEKVRFRDRLKPRITDSDLVAEAPLESPLKRMRKQRKVRPRDVANLADVSQGHLSEVETGIAMPCDKLSRLLQAMNLLEAQREFIRMTQIRTKRRSYHQLIGPGGDVDGLPKIGNEEGNSH